MMGEQRDAQTGAYAQTCLQTDREMKRQTEQNRTEQNRTERETERTQRGGKERERKKE